MIQAYLDGQGGLMALAIGSLLAGRYEITAPIATGGMGEVWKARDRVLDRIVAAKVLKSEFTGDPSFLARFRNEARHTAALTHPNIASVYDYGETVDDTGTQQLAFLVMEFVEGQPLVTILHDEGALPVDWTLHVLEPVRRRALRGAPGRRRAPRHQAGQPHGPPRRRGEADRLRHRPGPRRHPADPHRHGRRHRPVPLPRAGAGHGGHRRPPTSTPSASSAYECLAGVRPFDGASQVAIALAHINRPPPPLPSHVPPAVRLLVERALAKDPADRFPDGGAFAEAIRRVAAGGTLAPVVPARAAHHPDPDRRRRGDRRRRWPAARWPPRRWPTPAPRSSRRPARGALAGAAGPATGPAAADAAPAGAPGDDDWDAVDDEDPRGGRGKWVWLAAAVVLLLLLVGGTWFLLDDGNRGPGAPPAGTSTAQTSAAPDGHPARPGRVHRPAGRRGAGRARGRRTHGHAEGRRRRGAGERRAGARRGRRRGPATRPACSPPPGTAVVLYVAQKAYDPAGRTDAPTTTTQRPRRPPPADDHRAAHDDAGTADARSSADATSSPPAARILGRAPAVGSPSDPAPGRCRAAPAADGAG